MMSEPSQTRVGLRREFTCLQLIVAVLTSASLLAACSVPEEDAQGATRPAITGIRYLAEPVAGDFERAVAPRVFQFPRDHGAHPGFRTEWWYFTGNLFTDSGRHFGFELTFFRVGLKPAGAAQGADSFPASEGATGTGPGSGGDVAENTGLLDPATSIWLAHFAVTDTGAREFHAAERLSRGHERLAYARIEPLGLRVEDWYAEQSPSGTVRLIAATADVAIDLVLEGLDRIVLQGDQGLDPKGPEPGNASYYYSAPRLSATGELRSGHGETHNVVGTAWLDREWGTSALSPDVEGWDWFALQLNDGRDLMYYRLRRPDGSTSSFSSGSVAGPTGASTHLTAAMVSLVATEYWRSERSGVRYPIAWQIAIPSEGLELEVTPYLPNQEVDLMVRYWEGAVRVTGKAAGRPLEGQGYLELAGY